MIRVGDFQSISSFLLAAWGSKKITKSEKPNKDSKVCMCRETREGLKQRTVQRKVVQREHGEASSPETRSLAGSKGAESTSPGGQGLGGPQARTGGHLSRSCKLTFEASVTHALARPLPAQGEASIFSAGSRITYKQVHLCISPASLETDRALDWLRLLRHTMPTLAANIQTLSRDCTPHFPVSLPARLHSLPVNHWIMLHRKMLPP